MVSLTESEIEYVSGGTDETAGEGEIVTEMSIPEKKQVNPG